jgi:aryl-alcohol dehydrogenase-like predicted oxidoreductase
LRRPVNKPAVSNTVTGDVTTTGVDAFGVVSQSLGGGGLGQIWGETSRDEAVAVLHEAVESGISLIDLAPLYGRGEAEAVAGEAFGGKWPSHLRVTTKCMIGERHYSGIASRLEKSVLRSLDTMKREQADIFFLHSNICPDDYVYGLDPAFPAYGAVRESVFFGEVVPAFEKLKQKGLIGAWGIGWPAGRKHR